MFHIRSTKPYYARRPDKSDEASYDEDDYAELSTAASTCSELKNPTQSDDLVPPFRQLRLSPLAYHQGPMSPIQQSQSVDARSIRRSSSMSSFKNKKAASHNLDVHARLNIAGCAGDDGSEEIGDDDWLEIKRTPSAGLLSRIYHGTKKKTPIEVEEISRSRAQDLFALFEENRAERLAAGSVEESVKRSSGKKSDKINMGPKEIGQESMKDDIQCLVKKANFKAALVRPPSLNAPMSAKQAAAAFQKQQRDYAVQKPKLEMHQSLLLTKREKQHVARKSELEERKLAIKKKKKGEADADPPEPLSWTQGIQNDTKVVPSSRNVAHGGLSRPPLTRQLQAKLNAGPESTSIDAKSGMSSSALLAPRPTSDSHKYSARHMRVTDVGYYRTRNGRVYEVDNLC